MKQVINNIFFNLRIRHGNLEIGCLRGFIHKNLLQSPKFEYFTLGEVIEISSNQYGLSIFSGLISLIALGVYTLLTVDPGNDDDDSDSGSGGLMQPINQFKN